LNKKTTLLKKKYKSINWLWAKIEKFNLLLKKDPDFKNRNKPGLFLKYFLETAINNLNFEKDKLLSSKYNIKDSIFNQVKLYL
jgi:hypothetical protein